MSTPQSSRFVRLRVELILEIDDPEAVTGAALRRIAADESGAPAGERAHAESVVTQDAAEALAHLIDPFDLVSDVPGIELAQASWSGEHVEHDPDRPDWDADDEDDDDFLIDDLDGMEGLDGLDHRVAEEAESGRVG